MTGETQQGMVAAVRHLAPLLEGMPADDIPAVSARADRYLYGNYAAKSTIEMALHDALGRTTGKPAFELLGRRRRGRVAMLRLIGTGSTAGDIDDARRKQAEGYVAFKVKVGVAAPAQDAERTREICKALGNGASLLLCADANQGWSPDQAIEYVRAIEDLPLAFFEQPVPGDDVEGMARVARASRIKIGFDEGLHGIEDLKRHHAAGAAQGVSLKTIKLGGMGPVLEAAGLCEQLGMKVNLACKVAESSIATAAMLHIAAAVPTLDWGVALSHQFLADDLLKQPLAIAHGHAEVPAGPGLGIEVDETKVRRYAREV
jgi:L-alanine-DL-glutamate epimerase-like enolase superfamily enzyme